MLMDWGLWNYELDLFVYHILVTNLVVDIVNRELLVWLIHKKTCPGLDKAWPLVLLSI